jgi:16S rRNA (uracil1498-N3)-methyltransferase
LKFRRFCAAVLTTALLCGLCLPASGASRSSFVDVTNDTTAVNADVLRLMGVVSGVGDNRFMPDATLSRAEFCVMVTNFIQRGDEVSRYAARTIFRDVTGSHWARGYVNLMATSVNNSPAMISGIGDGSFAPDQKVTVAQAITVLLRVLEQSAADTEPPYIATVYQALVKGDKMETVIQKAVETGASVIVPMVTSRAVVKLDEKDARKKTERWQKIAHEAAKQCGRGIIPQVTMPVSYKEAMRQAAEADLALFCYEGDGTKPLPVLCRNVDSPRTVSLCIGPEGGFADGEAEAAKEAGLQMCGLGKRILRTETAALFVLSCLSAIYEL